MKTSELTGAALDWAVTRAHQEGELAFDYYIDHKGRVMEEKGDLSWHYTPSTYWAQGGPIIERTCASVFVDRKHAAFEGHPEEFWFCEISEGGLWSGPTPLIAAMRCYVASKMGDNIDIPEELK